MSGSRVRLAPSWAEPVGDFLERPQMRALSEFLRAEQAAGKRIFPPGSQMFAALEQRIKAEAEGEPAAATTAPAQ